MNGKQPNQRVKNLFIAAGIILVLFLLNKWENGQLGSVLTPFQTPRLQLFTILVLSVLLEGLPFLLLGALISGAIEVLVPEEPLKKLFPANRFFSSLVGSCLGLCFPVCSCGNIPVTRRLIKKGVPVAGALSYLLAAPIINVITISSTFIAFPGYHKIVLARVVLALFVAVLIGCMLGSSAEKEILTGSDKAGDACDVCCHEDDEDAPRPARILHHAGEDFFHTGKFLVLGASVAGLFQTFLTRNALLVLASHPVYPVFLLGAMAMVFCLCSFADAFVASTFTAFSTAAKTTFMVLGPMANAAVILLYLGIFKKRFVIKLVSWVAGSVLVVTILWEVIRKII